MNKFFKAFFEWENVRPALNWMAIPLLIWVERLVVITLHSLHFGSLECLC